MYFSNNNFLCIWFEVFLFILRIQFAQSFVAFFFFCVADSFLLFHWDCLSLQCVCVVICQYIFIWLLNQLHVLNKPTTYKLQRHPIQCLKTASLSINVWLMSYVGSCTHSTSFHILQLSRSLFKTNAKSRYKVSDQESFLPHGSKTSAIRLIFLSLQFFLCVHCFEKSGWFQFLVLFKSIFQLSE